MSNLQHIVEDGGAVKGDIHRSLMAQLINRMIEGQTNAVGSFTLTENVASSTIVDNLFQSTMVPLFIPTTANAAAEVGAGGMYVSARAKGSFTITHANNAQTDRDFIYVRMG